MRSVVPAAVIVAALLAAGSAAAGKPKLSEVAEKAKKPPAEQTSTPPEELSQQKTKQPVPTLPPPPSPPSSGTWVAGPPLPPYPHPAPVAYVLVDVEPWYVAEEDPWNEPRASGVRGRLGLVGGGGGVAIDAMDGYGGGGLLVGLEKAGWSVDVRGWRSSASFGRDLSEAFRDLHAWSADVVLGAPVSVGGIGPSVRLLAGARMGRLDWSFRNAVAISAGTGVRQVSRDTLGFSALFGGLELEVFREAEWAFAVTVAAGGQRFAADTGEGFENDVFESGPLIEGTAQLVFFPSRPARR